MTLTILAAAAAVYSWKLLGHMLPAKLSSLRFQKSADAITIALLAALVGVQGFTSGSQIVLDERFAALAVAIVLLLIRAPFIVIVVAAAVAAALLRML
jgi:hypothetical protein